MRFPYNRQRSLYDKVCQPMPPGKLIYHFVLVETFKEVCSVISLVAIDSHQVFVGSFNIEVVMFVEQLVESLHPTQEIRGSNTTGENFFVTKG